MNSAQKIVKYFAIGFAMLLIVSILSAILFGGLGVLQITNLISTGSNAELSCEADEKPCLKIAVSYSELEFKIGDSLSATSDYDRIEIKQSEDELLINEKNGELFTNKSKKTTVYIPEDYSFKKIEIKGGVGKIQAESLSADDLNVSLGVSESVFNNLNVKTAKISTGVGRVVLNLQGNESNYEIKAKKGLGSITFNGQSVDKDATLGTGAQKISLEGGIGEIIINTTGEKDS